ncbi:MAG TPA: hypothetical protein VF601_04830 [Beijerinckiaceae bacterium]|jgi:hypothetical protein
MRLPILAGLACALLLADAAVAQAPPAPAGTEAPAAPAKPRAKRAAAPKPAAAVTVTNASTHTATRIVITGDDDQTATVSKPLAPKAKAVVKLPKLKGCTVSVQATFESEGLVDVGEFDVCKEKTIRFTD